MYHISQQKNNPYSIPSCIAQLCVLQPIIQDMKPSHSIVTKWKLLHIIQFCMVSATHVAQEYTERTTSFQCQCLAIARSDDLNTCVAMFCYYRSNLYNASSLVSISTTLSRHRCSSRLNPEIPMQNCRTSYFNE